MYINVIRKKVSFFLGFLSVLILFSCVPASDVPLPTEEEIKNDLLNEKLGNWTFSKLEEFNTVTIVNKNIVDELNLEMDVDLNLNDYVTGIPYQGKVMIKYKRTDETSDKWIFSSIEGTISAKENTSYEMEDLDKPIDDAIVNKPWMNEDAENEGTENQSETSKVVKVRTLTCSYCGNEYTQKYIKQYDPIFDFYLEAWVGGTNHCDPNYHYKQSSGEGMYELMTYGDRTKYCTRKCACEAGEE